MNETTTSTETILRELERRQHQEHRSLLCAIREHQSAIETLEHRLASLEPLNASEPPPAPDKPHPYPPQRQEPRFGPCATRILHLMKESRLPLSESELLRCTKYSPVMFRKAIADLLVTSKIIRTGDPRKPAYLIAPQPPATEALLKNSELPPDIDNTPVRGASPSLKKSLSVTALP